jgi:CRP/FNR family transcriptional regulator, nitrogen fixation regulation protein
MFSQHGSRQEHTLQPTTADADLARVLDHTTASSVAFYPTNSVIYAQGESAGPLYLVEFGTVRVYRISTDGRRQITSFYFAGEVFGFEADPEHQCYAESVDGVGIRTLRIKAGEQVAEGLLRLALRGIARIQSHMLMLGRASATARLAKFLLDLMDQQESDDGVALQMQRADIGDYLGMTFETVSRVLHVFKERGLVQLPTADRVLVPSRERLASLCA